MTEPKPSKTNNTELIIMAPKVVKPTCDICCETFTATTRKAVKCPNASCLKDTCMGCVKRYLSETLEDPHCMHCRHPWDLFFVNSVLHRSFMTTVWKDSRTALLYQRERAFFPEAMELVGMIREKGRLEMQKTKIAQQMRELKRQEQRLQDNLWTLNDDITGAMNGQNVSIKEGAKGSFNIRQCPHPNCKGFMNTRTGHCPLCDNTSCITCNIVKIKNETEDREHECRPQDVETWEAIKKGSKPCPNCATMTERVSGCPQMWCPGCKKAWNWNTGKIETGPVHNPHFYEYTARLGLGNGQEAPAEVDPCNERQLWNFYTFQQPLRCVLTQNDLKTFSELHAGMNHIFHHVLEGLRTKVTRPNTDLRVDFLMDKVDEKNYKKLLGQREIQRQKDVRLTGCLEAAKLSTETFLVRLMRREIQSEDFFKGIKGVETFVNETISQINECFKSNISPMHFKPTNLTREQQQRILYRY